MGEGVKLTIALRDGRIVHGVLPDTDAGRAPPCEANIGHEFVKWLTVDGFIMVRLDDIETVLYGEYANLAGGPLSVEDMLTPITVRVAESLRARRPA